MTVLLRGRTFRLAPELADEDAGIFVSQQIIVERGQ